jgi:hypothetical protein
VSIGADEIAPTIPHIQIEPGKASIDDGTGPYGPPEWNSSPRCDLGEQCPGRTIHEDVHLAIRSFPDLMHLRDVGVSDPGGVACEQGGWGRVALWRTGEDPERVLKRRSRDCLRPTIYLPGIGSR